jgi:hypothetical protein
MWLTQLFVAEVAPLIQEDFSILERWGRDAYSWYD